MWRNTKLWNAIRSVISFRSRWIRETQKVLDFSTRSHSVWLNIPTCSEWILIISAFRADLIWSLLDQSFSSIWDVVIRNEASRGMKVSDVWCESPADVLHVCAHLQQSQLCGSRPCRCCLFLQSELLLVNRVIWGQMSCTGDKLPVWRCFLWSSSRLLSANDSTNHITVANTACPYYCCSDDFMQTCAHTLTPKGCLHRNQGTKRWGFGPSEEERTRNSEAIQLNSCLKHEVEQNVRFKSNNKSNRKPRKTMCELWTTICCSEPLKHQAVVQHPALCKPLNLCKYFKINYIL